MSTRIKLTRSVVYIMDVDTDDPVEAAERAKRCLKTPGRCPGCRSLGFPREEVTAEPINNDAASLLDEARRRTFKETT